MKRGGTVMLTSTIFTFNFFPLGSNLWYSHILLGQFIPAKSTYYAGIAQHGTPCADLQTRIQRVQSLMNAYQPRYQVKCVNTVAFKTGSQNRYINRFTSGDQQVECVNAVGSPTGVADATVVVLTSHRCLIHYE